MYMGEGERWGSQQPEVGLEGPTDPPHKKPSIPGDKAFPPSALGTERALGAMKGGLRVLEQLLWLLAPKGPWTQWGA